MTVEHDHSLLVLSTTFYRAHIEHERILAELTLQSAKDLKARGFPVLVIDGGSYEGYREALAEIGVEVVLQEESGLGNARREVVSAALRTDAKYFLYTELEKVGFMGAVSDVYRLFSQNDVEVVIPRRRSLSSYPSFQAHSEALGNEVWKRVTGKDLDIYFGPRAWRRDLSHYFLDYHGDYGDLWDVIMIPILHMVSDKRCFAEVVLDYDHPSEQTEYEEKHLQFINKRLHQLELVSRALIAEWESLAAKRVESGRAKE